MPGLPLMLRLDGRCFHRFTEGLQRPYDPRLCSAMQRVTTAMVEETNAVMGYTQSDEITLCLYCDGWRSQLWFDGRVQKTLSSAASLASVLLNKIVAAELPAEYSLKNPTFDCRAWVVPNKEEAAADFHDRELDATRNAIQMAACHFFSHQQVHNKSCAQLQDMLFSIVGVNFNNYPAYFKRGSWVQSRRVLRKFTPEELHVLPPRHEARSNPDLEVERREVRRLDMPIFSKVVNQVDVIFSGHEPVESHGG